MAGGSDSMAGIVQRIVTAVLVRDEQVLLCHRHPDRRWYPNVWGLPGGHAHADEPAVGALIRELREELGIEVGALPTTPIGSEAPTPDLSIDAWIVRDWNGEVRNLASDEHDRLGWFGLDEISSLELAHRNVGELCALALAAGQRRFRFAGPADADGIAAYHHRCWVESFSLLLDPGSVAATDPFGKFDRWRSWLAPGSGFRTVVADVDGCPVGHVTVRGRELVHLFIDPDHQGDHQGGALGRSLLAVGEALILVGGEETAELRTIVGFQPAVDLYRSAGWAVTDQLVHNDYDGVVYDELVLRKRLRP